MTVLNQRFLALHAHHAVRCDLTRTGLQQPGTSKLRAPLYSGSDALIGGDAVA